MRFLLGAIRIAVVCAIIFVGTIIALMLAWIPVRIKGVRLPSWIARSMARSAIFVFGLHVVVHDHKRMVRHHGLVFPNHVSYLDVIVLAALMPVRFLANHKVRSMPFIGWLARAIETVFVDRDNRKDRARARHETAEKLQKQLFPPLALFPEGRIGPGPELLPLRFGAFKIAGEGSIPVLPLAIRYTPLNVARWRDGEGLFHSVWRFVSRKEKVTVELTPLEEFVPGIPYDAISLAEETRMRLESVLLAE